MKCKRCGFENKEDSRFCEKCGYKLIEEQSTLKSRFPLVIGLIVAVCVVAVVGFYLVKPGEEIPAQAGPWTVKGQLVDFASTCDLKPEPSGPLSVQLSGNFTMTGCTTLDQELQQSLALIITIRNATSTNRTLTVPLLSDVIVCTNGDSEYASAFCIPNQWISTGGSSSWVTKVEDGILRVEIAPDGAVELLYLVPQFSGEVTIELVDIGSFKIEPPKTHLLCCSSSSSIQWYIPVRRAPIHAQLHVQLHAPIHAPPVKVRDGLVMIHHASTPVSKEHVRPHAPTHVDIPVGRPVELCAQSRAG